MVSLLLHILLWRRKGRGDIEVSFYTPWMLCSEQRSEVALLLFKL